MEIVGQDRQTDSSDRKTGSAAALALSIEQEVGEGHFRVGDSLKVYVKIVEGEKERHDAGASFASAVGVWIESRQLTALEAYIDL
jgi:ribosomal protein L19